MNKLGQVLHLPPWFEERREEYLATLNLEPIIV
jgi:hypothetical protein